MNTFVYSTVFSSVLFIYLLCLLFCSIAYLFALFINLYSLFICYVYLLNIFIHLQYYLLNIFIHLQYYLLNIFIHLQYYLFVCTTLSIYQRFLSAVSEHLVISFLLFYFFIFLFLHSFKDFYKMLLISLIFLKNFSEFFI